MKIWDVSGHDAIMPVLRAPFAAWGVRPGSLSNRLFAAWERGDIAPAVSRMSLDLETIRAALEWEREANEAIAAHTSTLQPD